MSKHSFHVTPVGGFLAPLPHQFRVQIAERWPALDMDAIDRTYGWYLLLRDKSKGQMPANEIAQIVQEFQAQVNAMSTALSHVRGNNIGRLVEEDPLIHGYEGVLDNLWECLEVLKMSLPRTITSLPKGHLVNPRHLMVADLLPQMQQAKLPIDCKPNGAVCHVTGVFLEAAGEATSSVVAIVRPVIAELKK